jgi:hypothetical protein
MSFDDLQSKWQSHNHGTSLNVDSDLLLKEVQRNHQTLESSLLRRDIVEVVAAAVVTGVFGFMAVRLNEWSLFLCSFGGLFVGTFFVVDRWIQSRKHPRPATDQSLQSCIQTSLVQVNHQIWLLKNIFWWYLLPLIPGMVAFLSAVGWKMHEVGPLALLLVAAVGLLCAFVFWGVYLLNQQAVKKTFEPRRDELEALLASLKS